jgi:hypothetical protein
VKSFQKKHAKKTAPKTAQNCSKNCFFPRCLKEKQEKSYKKTVF